jgi:drug/metabolite transporter (DMT)-like permease
LAALIFVLEPVFAALLAFWLLGERLGAMGWAGAALVVVAMLVAELRRPRAWRVGGRSSPPA